MEDIRGLMHFIGTNIYLFPFLSLPSMIGQQCHNECDNFDASEIECLLLLLQLVMAPALPLFPDNCGIWCVAIPKGNLAIA